MLAFLKIEDLFQWCTGKALTPGLVAKRIAELAVDKEVIWKKSLENAIRKGVMPSKKIQDNITSSFSSGWQREQIQLFLQMIGESNTAWMHPWKPSFLDFLHEQSDLRSVFPFTLFLIEKRVDEESRVLGEIRESIKQQGVSNSNEKMAIAVKAVASSDIARYWFTKTELDRLDRGEMGNEEFVLALVLRAFLFVVGCCEVEAKVDLVKMILPVINKVSESRKKENQSLRTPMEGYFDWLGMQCPVVHPINKKGLSTTELATKTVKKNQDSGGWERQIRRWRSGDVRPSKSCIAGMCAAVIDDQASVKNSTKSEDFCTFLFLDVAQGFQRGVKGFSQVELKVVSKTEPEGFGVMPRRRRTGLVTGEALISGFIEDRFSHYSRLRKQVSEEHSDWKVSH